MAEALSPSPPPTLNVKRILAIYTPLALSWLFMAVEGPADMAMLGLAPDYKINASGFLLVLGLSIWIESPVIDLLSTTTTLGSSRQRWVTLSGFTWLMMLTVATVHGLVAFTPLYDAVTRGLMGVNQEIADASRVPLQIMTPWSALVGWRRYLHGFQIKHGDTKPITVGTLIRITALCLTGFPLIYFTNISGLEAVSYAMVAAVGAESLFTHIISRRVINNLPDRPEETITFGRLAKFHLPLTASTMVMLSSPVLVTRALARAGNQELTLAGWQTASSMIWIFRSMTFALPEAVISLYNPGEPEKLLRRFCLTMGFGLTGLMVLFHLTGLDGLWFAGVYGTNPDTTAVSRMAFLACAALPALGAVMSFYRGVLTAHHVTWVRILAIAVAVVALFISLEVGLAFGWAGVVVGAFGLSVAQFAENGALAYALRQYAKKNPEKFEVHLPIQERTEQVSPVHFGGTAPAPDPAPVPKPGRR